MTIERIENTSLWKSTLAVHEGDTNEQKREELRVAFLKLRENISHLVTKISAVLPELTQHEISHLDALWETASLITGDDYPLTPLEGFVLGGSILLHDSALCFEAFEGGQDAIRDTPQWKDSHASFDNIQDDQQREHQADFMALRLLHAEQAEFILEKKWIDPDNGQEIYLLENQSLRKHLGKLIGIIASSHHWDIETLSSKLDSQINALSGFPREWRIDAVKIACILRCADASHIDNERAPDFLHALLKRHGVSFNHWQAQNRLAAVDIDQSSPEKNILLFTSTIDFKESEAESWFVAYDAICLVDKEITACNNLLDTPFKVQGVQGVENPESMSKYVKADGWKPCSTEVHVGNIEKIIKTLGGEALYGVDTKNMFSVAIRELIQNSRDSIHARRFLEPSFEGHITITIERTDGKVFITVEDNGIGMSERVLTGTLLDFGTSFWSSNLIQSEFPGLRSSTFKSIGRFGIGFYSIFMIAKNVHISTKRWDEGLPDLKHLKFTNGFSLRPILSHGSIEGFSTSSSTKVKFELKEDIIPDDFMIEVTRNIMGAVNFNVHIKDYISALCAGLDASVYFIEDAKTEERIHTDIESDSFNKEEWLKTISFTQYQNNNNEHIINSNLQRVKPIIENGKIKGMAAISTIYAQEQNFLSILTVGGLAQSVHGRDSNNFIGYIDHNPKSAKREIDKFSASKKTISDWAQDQLNEILSANSLDSYAAFTAACSLCHFGVDPTPIAKILVANEKQMFFFDFNELAELSTSKGIAFILSSIRDFYRIETHHEISFINGYELVRPLQNSSFLSLRMEGDIPCNNNSILDCLYRTIISKGYSVNFTTVEDVGVNAFGQKLKALIISSEKPPQSV